MPGEVVDLAREKIAKLINELERGGVPIRRTKWLQWYLLPRRGDDEKIENVRPIRPGDRTP